MVNPMLLLEVNPYHSLQEMEKEVGISKVDDCFSLLVFTKEHRGEHNTQDIFLKIQTVEFVSKANNQFSKDKQLFVDKVQQADRSLALNEFKTNEVVNVDITHADMNCGKIVAFTTTAKLFDRASIVDKHMPMHAHKLTGQDISSSKRKLRVSEDGRKGGDIALAERRLKVQNMNDG